MPISQSHVLAVCVAALLAAAASGVARAKDDKPIDPTCLMVCVKWTGDNCDKFEMKCKGDPGYPSASTVKPGKATAGTLKDSGKASNAGNEGKSTMQKGTDSKSVQP